MDQCIDFTISGQDLSSEDKSVGLTWSTKENITSNSIIQTLYIDCNFNDSLKGTEVFKKCLKKINFSLVFDMEINCKELH